MTTTRRVTGTMVACLACKSVVWAHDSDMGDLRGTCNIFGLPCPECGARGNYDGYSVVNDTDAWRKMHEIAEDEGWAWKNGPHMFWRLPGDSRGGTPNDTQDTRYQGGAPRCGRCRRSGRYLRVDREVKGGICGSCADDLREERDAHDAASLRDAWEIRRST